jgi:oligopeptide transport system substrate-binding protein
MSVMNRPDGGPQPRHAIERDGETWTETGRQVVSGAFEIAERQPDRLVLRRREQPGTPRPGNVATVEYMRKEIPDAIAAYARDELDAVTVRYTPKTADLVPGVSDDAHLGAASWSGFLAFRHADPRMANVEFRRALASAIDRDTLADQVPSNLVVANGGIVPPALQGHTPDIVPRFDPETAREHLRSSGLSAEDLGGLELAGIETWLDDFLLVVSRTWKEVLDIDVPVRPWTLEDALSIGDPTDMAPIVITGWLPGYADPEYFLRLLFQTDSKTNYGGFSDPEFDRLIERARQERSDRSRLELFHEADRMAVADRIACIPLVYGRSMAFVKRWVTGWWEFGKSSSSVADLMTAGSSSVSR